ncbi:Transposase IS4 [Popillia japonica]|uniref:Transposase IS4 n=1 Tax=Popillia japonica TaxID=7064 RepID=A0AAW1IA01_POPJA
MARNRFREIMRFLRFDQKSNRLARLHAHMSYVWDTFIENCQKYYKPGPYISIDEQLFPTKARCRFMQFMGSKPDKYGQKFWLAVDKESKYTVNGFPYLGKDDQRPINQRLGDHVVMKLMQPYLNKGRNVTCDNFFTSLALAETLETKRTSIVGTVNRARRETGDEVMTARRKC